MGRVEGSLSFRQRARKSTRIVTEASCDQSRDRRAHNLEAGEGTRDGRAITRISYVFRDRRDGRRQDALVCRVKWVPPFVGTALADRQGLSRKSQAISWQSSRVQGVTLFLLGEDGGGTKKMG